MELVLYGVALLLFIAVACYVGARAIGIAWYRTKLEYMRSVFREGDQNGK